MTQTTNAAQFRYRFEGNVSPWMSGDELQLAAQSGTFDDTADIQKSGHADWLRASDIRGLVFTAPDPVEEEEPEEVHEETDRLTRFGTLRELLAAFVREEIELDIETPGTFTKHTLCAMSSDHFEIIDDEGKERVFIPLHRIRTITAMDTGAHGSNYKANHLLRVSLV